jgi:hypothetical protein
MGRIVIDSAVMGGLPCVRDTRLPVATIAGLLAENVTIEAVLELYPPATVPLWLPISRSRSSSRQLRAGGQQDILDILLGPVKIINQVGAGYCGHNGKLHGWQNGGGQALSKCVGLGPHERIHL